MKKSEKLSETFNHLVQDERITVWHISMYTALLYLWTSHKCVNPIAINRRKLMKLAHISSIVTYHKCIKQLQEYGYIHYVPSYNCYFGSRVFLLFSRLKG